MVVEVDGRDRREQTRRRRDQRLGDPGPTTVRLVEPCRRWLKAIMMPDTVPNRPMNGVMLAVVARNVHACSSLFTSVVRRASNARSTAVEALQHWTRRRLRRTGVWLLGGTAR